MNKDQRKRSVCVCVLPSYRNSLVFFLCVVVEKLIMRSGHVLDVPKPRCIERHSTILVIYPTKLLQCCLARLHYYQQRVGRGSETQQTDPPTHAEKGRASIYVPSLFCILFLFVSNSFAECARPFTATFWPVEALSGFFPADRLSRLSLSLSLSL